MNRYAIALMVLGSTLARAADPVPSAPSAANLNKLVGEYYNLSLQLENQMKVVQTATLAMTCEPTGMFSGKMRDAVAGQSAQRARIYDSLKNSNKALNDQVAALSKTDLGSQAATGQAAIDASKKMIADGVDTPTRVIDAELAAGLPYLKQMEDNYGRAAGVLRNPGCGNGYQAFADPNSGVYVLAHAVPRKVNDIKAALAARKSDLTAWADLIKSKLVTGSETAAVAQK
jgi:hypothetical protein